MPPKVPPDIRRALNDFKSRNNADSSKEAGIELVEDMRKWIASEKQCADSSIPKTTKDELMESVANLIKEIDSEKQCEQELDAAIKEFHDKMRWPSEEEEKKAEEEREKKAEEEAEEEEED